MNKNRTRILHVIPTLRKGGAERIVLDICNELSRHTSVEVRLLTFIDENEYSQVSKNFRHDVVPASVSPSLSGKTRVNISRLNEYIQGYKPDIIHSHLFEADLVTRWEPLPGICYFSHAHCNTPEILKTRPGNIFSKKTLIAKYVYSLINKKYKQSNNYFITISHDSDDYYRMNLPDFNSRIFYLPNAINVSSFDQGEARKIDKLKLLRMISVGSINERKNQLFQVEIASELKKRGVKFHLDILGNGSMFDTVKKKIEEGNLGNEISLLGNRDDVNEQLLAHDIFLHTAVYEPFGLVILEAMAAGLPVVCLDGKGNREIMNNGCNGFILSSQDYCNFAEKITEIIDGQDLYSRMSHNARLTARSYDIGPYIEKLIGIYSDVMKKTGNKHC